ncbi:type II toxin-antitoxin system RelE/ParE family toxin, partial [Vibrio vulnificus]|nr:type II toxin-antitoxin system RelE/ParE family toxin [Vibrio vulnificus]
ALDGGFSDPACDAIDKQIAQLAKQPERGAPGRVVGTRELPIEHTPYVVAYMVTPLDPLGESIKQGTKIQVVRILHATKQQPKWDKRSLNRLL